MVGIRASRRVVTRLAVVAAALLAVAGCHRNRSSAPANPQTLPPETTYKPVLIPGNGVPPATTYKPTPIPITKVPPGGVSDEDLAYVETHTPIATQTGNAAWYVAPYKGRKAANGMVFDNDAMTAAHRTLPMGSLIKVTNLKTDQSAVLRITDRGPFTEGRILDLTVAAAKATGVYRPGWARVRVDIYSTPKPIATGGRWCVQIGAFLSETEALRLKAELQKLYADAQVIEFPGEKSYWVRIRPQGDNREMAEYIAEHLHPSEGNAYLTRLD